MLKYGTLNEQKTENDFSIITELPQTFVPEEQLERYYQRYAFASGLVNEKRVLEIGCGGGQGLSLLQDAGAQSIVAVDIDDKNLSIANSTYNGVVRIKIKKADANHLKFDRGSFDCILMYEVLYYLSDLKQVLRNCYDMLAPGGSLIIESANIEWEDFNPSPFSTIYYSARDLYDLMEKCGFTTQLYRSFPISTDPRPFQKILSVLKRTAIKFRLIPKSMKYKKYLKRLFLGKHVLFPSRLSSSMCQYREPTKIDHKAYNTQFKVLFALGAKSE